MTTLEVDAKVLVMAGEDAVGTVVWRFEGATLGIIPYEDEIFPVQAGHGGGWARGVVCCFRG